jgi:hypothetical protein
MLIAGRGNGSFAESGSRAGCYMTKEELLAFYDEYIALLRKYGHSAADAPDGARPMALRFFALPQPDESPPGPPPA